MRRLVILLLLACTKTVVPPSEPSTSSSFALASADPPPKAKPPVATPTEAIAAFRAAWPNVMRAPVDRPFVMRMDPILAQSPEHFSAKRSTCSAAHAKIKELFTSLHYDYTTYGSIDAIDRAGDCFVVDFIKGLKEDLEGIVTPEGELLFIWRIPEG
jgi:hypothetical protein